MTVLLGLVAASITLVIVRTALDDARVTASRRAYDLAYGSARDVAASLARTLNSDPTALLDTVSENEPDRLCEALQVDGAATRVTAGAQWPAACGTRWSYATSDDRTVVWVQLPEPGSPHLLIRAVSEVAGTRAGVEMQLRPGDLYPTLFSETDLDLGELSGGSSTSELNGLIYTSGSLTVPAAGVSLDNVALAAESSISGTVDSNVGRYVGSGVGNGVDPVRDLLPKPLVPGSLRGRVATMSAVACRGGVHANTAAGSNHLCLTAGATLSDATSQSVQVPATVAAWLLLPERSSVGTVDVYVKSTLTDLADSCPTGSPNCSLPAVAATTAGHPSRLDSWTALGTFKLPASGVTSTDTTTFLGLCGAGFSTPSGTCDSYRGSESGLNLETPATFVVGTVDVPADLYISGPVSSPQTDVGLVVSGDVLIPYWARPATGGFTVDADIIALGRSSDPILRTLPHQSVGNTNQGGTLTLRGTLAVTRLDVDLDVFANYRLLTSFRKVEAPWMALSNSWSIDRVRRLTSTELASPGSF